MSGKLPNVTSRKRIVEKLPLRKSVEKHVKLAGNNFSIQNVLSNLTLKTALFPFPFSKSNIITACFFFQNYCSCTFKFNYAMYEICHIELFNKLEDFSFHYRYNYHDYSYV